MTTKKKVGAKYSVVTERKAAYKRIVKDGGIWSKLVKMRAGNRCELCGGEDNLCAHHMVKKARSKFLQTRLENGCCLCRNEHYGFHYSTELPAWSYFQRCRPADYLYLRDNLHNVTRVDYIELEEVLKAELKTMAEKIA